MSHDIANAFKNGELTLPPTLSELVRRHEFGTGSAWLAKERQRLADHPFVSLSTHEWKSEVQRMLEVLQRPLVVENFEQFLYGVSRQADGLSVDAEQPRQVRRQAAKVSDMAGEFATKGDIQRLEGENRALRREVEKLGRHLAKYSREEATTDVRLEVGRFMQQIKDGARLCEDFDLYFSGADTQALNGTWLAEFFNGERAGGRSVEPILIQTSGKLYTVDTLSRHFNSCTDNPAPAGRGKPARWGRGDFFETLEKWVVAAAAAADSQAGTTGQVCRFA